MARRCLSSPGCQALGPWERQLLRTFVQHAGDVVDPCDSNFLISLLTEWFHDHPVMRVSLQGGSDSAGVHAGRMDLPI